MTNIACTTSVMCYGYESAALFNAVEQTFDSNGWILPRKSSAPLLLLIQGLLYVALDACSGFNAKGVNHSLPALRNWILLRTETRLYLKSL